jgi:putative transposase
MKRKRFTEEQIIAVLREHEAGAKAGDLARKPGISEATLYNWKAKYGGMGVCDAKPEGSGGRERKAEEVARRPDAAAVLKELLSKNGRAPPPSAKPSRIFRP